MIHGTHTYELVTNLPALVDSVHSDDPEFNLLDAFFFEAEGSVTCVDDMRPIPNSAFPAAPDTMAIDLAVPEDDGVPIQPKASAVFRLRPDTTSSKELREAENRVAMSQSQHRSPFANKYEIGPLLGQAIGLVAPAEIGN